MYAGIDLGGTNIAGGLTEDNGTILKKVSMPLGTAKNDPDEAVKKMTEVFFKLTEGGEKPKGLGVGSPGIVDSDRGDVIYASNIKFRDYPLEKKLSSALGIKVKLVNDANAAAYAECIAGAAKGADNAVMITLGTGIGGGIIIDRKIYTGHGFAAGEIGHMVICAGGRKCACGRRGCFETYASATGLIKTTTEMAKKYPESALAGISLEQIGGKTAFILSREGDEAAIKAVEEYIDSLAVGVANLISIFAPDVVVIGGGVSREGDPLFVPLRKRVKEYLGSSHVCIRAAALKNDAGIIGAALSLAI